MAKIIKIPSVFIYDSKVVGVSQNNENGSSRQEIIRKEVNEEDLLVLQTEPDNAFDTNAVKVLSKFNHQIGYLKRDLAEKVKPALDNETQVIVKATWVNGDEMVGVGIRIELIN